MRRKSNEKFIESGRRLKQLLDDYGMKQTTLGDKAHVSRTTINQIINGHKDLSPAIANDISKVFVDEDPDLLKEWLLGRINHRNIREQLKNAMDEMHHEGELLDIGLSAFAELSGFTIEPKTKLDGSDSFENFLHALNDGIILAKEGQAVSLTPLQKNRLQNEICDYIEFTLARVISGKKSL